MRIIHSVLKHTFSLALLPVLTGFTLFTQQAYPQIQRPSSSDEPTPGTQVLGGVNTWSLMNRANEQYYYLPFLSSLNRLTRNSPYRLNPMKLLDERGPQFPEAYSMSNLSVMGFVKGDWDVGIDYELEQTGFVIVTVMLAGAEPFQYRLSAAKRGRQQEHIKLPARFGNGPAAAVFSLRAFSDGVGEIRPISLRVYRIEAGERANDSSAVDNFRSNPGVIHPNQKEKASYDFHSLAELSKAETEVRLVKRIGPQVISTQVHTGKAREGVPPDQWVSEEWDGKNLDGKVSLGVHQIAVRSWSRVKAGGAWSVTWSREFLYVQ